MKILKELKSTYLVYILALLIGLPVIQGCNRKKNISSEVIQKSKISHKIGETEALAGTCFDIKTPFVIRTGNYKLEIGIKNYSDVIIENNFVEDQIWQLQANNYNYVDSSEVLFICPEVNYDMAEAYDEASVFLMVEEMPEFQTTYYENDYQSPGNNNFGNDANYKAGLLTASEINDFSKWNLWEDIAENDLKKYQENWQLYPLLRYSVQLVTKNDLPVIDALVELRSKNDNIIWRSRTDNTGKAELWANFVSNSRQDVKSISITFQDKVFDFQRPISMDKGINIFKLPVECENFNIADIAFIVDATSSMDDEIEFLKSELLDIITKTKSKYPDLTLNLGSVFYRCPDNSYVTKVSQFSSNEKKTLNFIKEQSADEGGDEAVEQALQVAVDDLKWSKSARTRLMFILLDEPPALNDESVKKIQNAITKASSQGIRIIPVVGSGEGYDKDRNLEYLLRSIALATNGTYVFLTDHSHIGRTHSVPVTDSYDVELLNDLLMRLINQYLYVPDCDGNIASENTRDTMYVYNPKIIVHVLADSSKIFQSATLRYASDTNLVDLTLSNIIDETDTNVAYNTTIESDADIQKSNDVDNFQSFKYYPNPTTGSLTIEIEGDIKELYLADINGKLLEKIEIKANYLKIDISMYPVGMYLLEYALGNKYLVGKVVLTK
jgi:hypothetical protein